jgi:hypothetical protein
MGFRLMGQCSLLPPHAISACVPDCFSLEFTYALPHLASPPCTYFPKYIANLLSPEPWFSAQRSWTAGNRRGPVRFTLPKPPFPAGPPAPRVPILDEPRGCRHRQPPPAEPLDGHFDADDTGMERVEGDWEIIWRGFGKYEWECE